MSLAQSPTDTLPLREKVRIRLRQVELPWDCILSAELARHYKPDQEVYETAARLLDLEPPSILMVAAHRHDLEGAKAVGFRTAFIARPLEWGPEGQADTAQDGDFDIIAQDFHDLATQLGV